MAVLGHLCSALNSQIATGSDRRLLDGCNHFQHIMSQRGESPELTCLGAGILWL